MQQQFQVFIDGGYFLHFSVFSAISRWSPPDQEYHETLDPMQYPDFVEVLEERAFGLLQNVFNKILPTKIESDLPVTAYPTIFSMECRGANNWRTHLYPQYKATRKLAKRICNTGPAYFHIQKLITGDSQFAKEFNLLPIQYERAEGDDIIAVLHDHIPAAQKLLIAVDRDFHQIEGTQMVDLFGTDKLVTESFGLDKRGYALTPKQYKLLKVLIGDSSDNLQKVFQGDGVVRCLKKYVSNLDFLKESLANDATAADQFKRNLELMDFGRIPNEIRSAIIEIYNEKRGNYDRTIANQPTSNSNVEEVFDYSLL
jgi:CRISPR/Cas system-associated protein endoribonuclease Cas2